MSSKFHIRVLLVSAILFSGGGMMMAKAQSSEIFPLYLPVIVKQEAQVISSATPTPTKTGDVTMTPTFTVTPTPTPTSVTQPIVADFVPVEDTYVDDRFPASNFGSSNVIFVGSYEGTQRGLLKFDLSAIPTGTHIINAVLSMNYQMRSGISTQAPTFTITAYRSSAAWSELSVMWNSQPSFAEAYATTSFSSWGSKTFGLTNLVQAWVNGTYPNDGVMLGGTASGNHAAGFCPRAGGAWLCSDTSGTPILSIIYDNPQ